jgi:AAA15 family ATPase/GTPase
MTESPDSTDFSYFKVRNFKCFGNEFTGFDEVKLINIIIGKNNAGKSALLDMLEFLRRFGPSKEEPSFGWKSLLNAKFRFKHSIREQDLRDVVNEVISQSGDWKTWGNDPWRHHGQLLIGLEYYSDWDSNKSSTERKEEAEISWVEPSVFKLGFKRSLVDIESVSQEIVKKRENLVRSTIHKQSLEPSQFTRRRIRRLSSERDIRLEKKRGSDSLLLKINGAGATSIIREYLVAANRDESLVRKNLLEALNEIFNPDNIFTRIDVKELAEDWEIYLQEETKGLIPLSSSGSGLKTIILVLTNLLLIPDFETTPNTKPNLSEYFFLFEELENNLHPALLRRLFRYLEDFALKNQCHFFITTHSNVIIDLFAGVEHAQILHVTHDGKTASVKPVQSFGSAGDVLDDIGAKASDLLQANGIVWLEGPSDRIYFNKWIELYTDGDLREHRDYECAFYGGAVLSHYSGDPTAVEADLINILRTNRNAVLMADSDRAKTRTHLKSALSRIKTELEVIGALIWITKPKEVENYIPAKAMEMEFSITELPEIGEIELFDYTPEKKKRPSNKSRPPGYWQQHGLKGAFDKVDFAHRIVRHLSKEMMKDRFDWAAQMDKIVVRIKEWNNK